MYYELFIDELIKRYMFLYENKDLILAMCIRRINVDEKINDSIKTFEDLKERAKISDRHLFDSIIDSYKAQLGIEKCYLCFNVSDEIVSAFEEVLFTDGDLEDTQLYKYVTALKNNGVFYESVNDMIEDLNSRRNANQFLAKVPTFTVWKILNYVREKNSDNSTALEALDKYYNIERTMFTGMDSDCGYVLKGDECYDDEKLSKYPCLTMIGGISGSYIISDYKSNGYEAEDDYMVYEHEDDFVPNGESTTIFMDVLSKMPMLHLNSKLDIRNRYITDVKKILE